MAPQFSQGKAAIKRPPVCIKPRPNLPTGYVAGKPTGLSAFAAWTDVANLVEIAESFRLYYDALLPGWSGESGHTGLNFKLHVVITATPRLYDVLLELRNGLAHLDDDSWHGIYIDPTRPWRSGLLEHVHSPGIDYNAVELLD